MGAETVADYCCVYAIKLIGHEEVYGSTSPLALSFAIFRPPSTIMAVSAKVFCALPYDVAKAERDASPGAVARHDADPFRAQVAIQRAAWWRVVRHPAGGAIPDPHCRSPIPRMVIGH